MGLHGVLAAALSGRTQVGGIAKHIGQRDQRVDLHGAGTALLTLDLTAAAVQVADDITQVLVGDDDGDLHHGLQQAGRRLAAGLLEGHGAGNLKGHLRGVDLMVGAEGQVDLHVHHRVASQHTGLHGALDTGVHRGDILLGDHAAGDLVEELVTLAGLVGLNGDADMAVLALTAGLTGVLGILLHRLLDGLLIGDLGSADIGLHLELTEQTVHDDLQVQLAHAGDDGLTGLLIGVGLKGGVLLSQLHQSQTHLLLTGLGLGLDGHADNRLGELHGLQNDGVLLIAEGVTSGGVLQADHSGDVAGVAALNVLTVIGVHLEDAANALLLLLGGVEHGGTGVQHAGVYTHKGQTAHEGIGGDLKGQGGEGGVVIGMTLILFLGIGINTLDGRNVHGRGHIVHDGVQQLLNTLVAVRGTADHRNHDVVNGALTDGPADHVLRNFLLLQNQHHDLLVDVGTGVQQLGAVLLGQLHHILGDGLHAHILAQLVVIDVGVHLHQINDALEGVLSADGQLDGHRVALEAVMNHVQNVVEVRAHDVHLVDVDHAGHAVVVGLTPHSLRLGLHAALGAHDGNRAVQHTQGTLHLHGEVHVTRGIDDVQTGLGELVLGALPVAGGSGGGDGDTTLLLLRHPVHGGGTIMGLTDLIVHAGVEQDTLGRRGLARIDVSHNADISGIFKRSFSRHTVTPNLPAEMCEGLVGLGGLVDFLALLHGSTGVVGGVHDLAGQTLGHGALTAGAGVSGQPAQTQGLATGRTHFHRHLIVGTAHAAGLDFQAGHDSLHSLGKYFGGFLLGLLLDLIEGRVNHLLGYALLAVQHHAVDELRHQHRAVYGIGQNLSLGTITSSGHYASLLHNDSMIS